MFKETLIMSDLNEFLDSLDERSLDTVCKVLHFLLDKIDEYEESQSGESVVKDSDDNSFFVEEEQKEDVHKILEEKGSYTQTRSVEPRIYHETINPSDWEELQFEENGDITFKHEREIYTDQYSIRESGLLSIDFEEDKMLEDRTRTETAEIIELINHIYADGAIKLVTDNVKGTFYYKGKERPRYPIYLVIEELPFPDCPASSMGL